MHNRLLLVVVVLVCGLLFIVNAQAPIAIANEGNNDWSVVGSGVTLKATGDSGCLKLRRNNESNTIEVGLDRLVEYGSSITDEVYDDDLSSQHFEWGTPTFELINSVNTTRMSFTATLDNNATIECIVNMFQADGVVTWGNSTYTIAKEHAKFTLKVRSWPFASKSNSLRVTMYIKINGGSYRPPLLDDKPSPEDAAAYGKSGPTQTTLEKRCALADYGVLDFAITAIIDNVETDVTYDLYTHGSKNGLAVNFPYFASTCDYDPTFGLNGAFARAPALLTFAALATALLAFFRIAM